MKRNQQTALLTVFAAFAALQITLISMLRATVTADIAQQHAYDIDFARNNNDNIDYADYRFGDFFYLYYLQGGYTFQDLQQHISTDFPNTIADFYIRALNGSPQYGYRNITLLVEAIATYQRKHSLHLPSKNELVVHLRLGDVMTDPKYAKVSTPVEELWNSPEGFVNLADYIKYNYSLDEWLQLIRQLPDPSGIEKITLVGSDVRRTIETYQDRNHQYLHLVTQLLQRSFPKANIHHLTSRNPDQALVYMASANWLLVGNGGFGQMAKACVNYGNEKGKQGKQRGLSEPFGFMLVAADDTRLTEPERRFFETHYVDTDNYFKRSFGRPWPKFLEQYM